MITPTHKIQKVGGLKQSRFDSRDSLMRTRLNQLHSLSANRSALIAFIDLNAKALCPAQRDNFEIWDIRGIYVWPNPGFTGSHAGEVAFMKQWLVTRMNWMDSQFNP